MDVITLFIRSPVFPSCYRLSARSYALWPFLSSAEDMWFPSKVCRNILQVLLGNIHPHGERGSARIHTLWDVHLWFWLRIRASMYYEVMRTLTTGGVGPQPLINISRCDEI